ncbi:MAG: hypothetical protein JWM76_94 [Pseudonocardiales bacterium]|nr:hypothetical protein [Pseudonocardiales bacterium]
MSPIDLTLILRASGPVQVADAWERYARPELWSSWSPQIRGVRYPHARIKNGATGRVIGPLGLRVGFEIQDVDEEAHRWSWRAAVGPVGIRLVHTVKELDRDANGAGTTTELRMVGPAPIVVTYAPIAQLALGRLVRTEPDVRPVGPRVEKVRR